MPTDVEWAWLAGILDGEGALQLGRSFQNGRAIYTPTCRVDMTHAGTIERIGAILTDAQIEHRRFVYKRKNVRHRAANIVSVNKLKDVRALLSNVLPYLVTKRRHADVLLSFVEHRIAIGYDWKRKGENGRFVNSYGEDEVLFYQQLKELNRRGTQEAGLEQESNSEPGRAGASDG